MPPTGKCEGGNPDPCNHCLGKGAECTWAPEDRRRPISRQLYEAIIDQNHYLEARNQELISRVERLEKALRDRRPISPPPSLISLALGVSDTELPQTSDTSLPKGQLDTNTDVDREISEDFGKIRLEDGGFYGDISAFSYEPSIEQQPAMTPSSPQYPSAPTPRYHLYTSDSDPGIRSDPCNHYAFLPPSPRLSRATHDTLLDRFFKFYAFWCMRVVPDYLLRDMYIALSSSASSLLSSFPGSRTASPVAIHNTGLYTLGSGHTPTPTNYYSPMLHNAIMSMALMYSDDPAWRLESTRMVFARAAVGFVEMDAERPTLATVLALAILSSFYSGLGKQGLGFMYFGLSIRMAQALGLNVNCSAWVQAGYISPEAMNERNLTYWCCYTQDTCWATYVGRESSMPMNQNRIPIPDVDPTVDAMMWEFPERIVTPDPVIDGLYAIIKGEVQEDEEKPSTARVIPARQQPCLNSTSFVQTCRLMRILGTEVFDLLYGIGKDPTRCKVKAISDVRVALDEWANELPESMKLNRKISKTVAPPSVLMVHTAYWWVMILLQRPLFRKSSTASSGTSSDAASTTNGGSNSSSAATKDALLLSPAATTDETPLKMCDRSVCKIMELLHVWRELYGLRFCPVTLIQITFTAGVTALMVASARRRQEKQHRISLTQARLCVEYLREMAEAWHSANQNGVILQRLVNQHCIEVASIGTRSRAARGSRGRGAPRVHPFTKPYSRRPSNSKKPQIIPEPPSMLQVVGEPSNAFSGVPPTPISMKFEAVSGETLLGLNPGVDDVLSEKPVAVQVAANRAFFPPVRVASPPPGFYASNFRSTPAGMEFDIHSVDGFEVSPQHLASSSSGGFPGHHTPTEEEQNDVVIDDEDLGDAFPFPEGFFDFEQQYEGAYLAAMRDGEGFPKQPAGVDEVGFLYD